MKVLKLLLKQLIYYLKRVLGTAALNNHYIVKLCIKSDNPHDQVTHSYSFHLHGNLLLYDQRDSMF